MTRTDLSDVEVYWNKIAEKAGDSRTWHDLSPRHQHYVLQSINALLFVLGDKE